MKKKMSILLSAAMLGCAFPLTVQGNTMVDEIASIQQNKTIKGRVLDANGEPVIGASVLEKGTTNGTLTDFDPIECKRRCCLIYQLHWLCSAGIGSTSEYEHHFERRH